MNFILILIIIALLFMIIHSMSIDHSRIIQLDSWDTDRMTTQRPSSNADICLTKGCVLSAARILESIDESVDPCDDFYKFACGEWIKKQDIPEERSFVSTSSAVDNVLAVQLKLLIEKPLNGSEAKHVKMLRQMYDSCMNLQKIEAAGSEPLQKLLETLGGWPVVMGDAWDGSSFDWMDTLFAFRELGLNHDILMNLHVRPDYRNNTVHVIYLDQAHLGKPYKLFPGLNDSLTIDYFNLMVKTANKLGADERKSEEELLEALNFEMKLSKLCIPSQLRRRIDNIYHKYSLKELQETVPGIDWLKYFNGMINDPITENETLIISNPFFIRKFPEIINATDKRTVANYMMWRVAQGSLSMLSKDWRDLQQEYRAVRNGKSREGPRWEQCLLSLSNHLDIALGSHYVRNYFDDDSKHRAMEIMKYIHKEFLSNLEKVDWMDEETRMHAIEKAKAITPYIGYPPEMLNDGLVGRFYENLTITNESYFDNIMRAWKWSKDQEFSQLKKPNIKGLWSKHAKVAIVNAFYRLSENSVDFPAGILQNVFFERDRPHYMNFGGIGNVIGHEIIHGFDIFGSQFDKEGNNRGWWDEITEDHFLGKVDCFIDQYDNYTAENGLQISGYETLGENIADNGGLKYAYQGYQSWVKDNSEELTLPGLKYAPNQLFWISVANARCTKYKPEALRNAILSGGHSPAPYRIIGPMSNLPEFAEDFQCPLGSPMNPYEKCTVW